MSAAIIDRVLRSNAGRALLASVDTETVKERRRLCAEIDATRLEQNAGIGALQDAERKAAEVVKAAEGKLKDLQRRAYEAQMSRFSACVGWDARIGAAECKLRDLEPAEVLAFVRWTREVAESERIGFHPPANVPVPAHLGHEAPEVPDTYLDRFKARQKRLREVADEAGSLCLQVLTDAEIVAHLEQLRAEIRAGAM